MHCSISMYVTYVATRVYIQRMSLPSICTPGGTSLARATIIKYCQHSNEYLIKFLWEIMTFFIFFLTSHPGHILIQIMSKKHKIKLVWPYYVQGMSSLRSLIPFTPA